MSAQAWIGLVALAALMIVVVIAMIRDIRRTSERCSQCGATENIYTMLDGTKVCRDCHYRQGPQ